MSLLLDALQRASQEKDKSSQAAAPEKTSAMALEPALPGDEATVAPRVEKPEAEAIPALEPLNQAAMDKPALEFSFKPEEIPAGAVPAAPHVEAPPEPTAKAPAPTMAAPKPAPPPAPVVDAPAPAPSAPPPFRETVPPPASQRPAAPPPLSPRTAREILGASAPRKKSGSRVIILASLAAVLALSLGGAYLFLAMPSNSGIQPPATASARSAAVAIPAASTPAAPAESAPGSAQNEPAVAPATPPAPAATPTAAIAEKPTPVATAKAPAPKTPAKSAPSQRTKVPAPTPLLLTKGSGGGTSPLETAYAALLDGRMEVAAEAYRRALAQNGEERDALLGLAYIAHRQGKRDDARVYYERVLRLDPENPVANSGMLAILAEGDPAAAASRARDIAEKNPGSAAAFATLGNILVREGNFADAQQAFFRAAALDPASAFHAYNLAVALDRLHKRDLAANYYARALALGEKPGQQAFPKETARQRLEQLRASQN